MAKLVPLTSSVLELKGSNKPGTMKGSIVSHLRSSQRVSPNPRSGGWKHSNVPSEVNTVDQVEVVVPLFVERGHIGLCTSRVVERDRVPEAT